MSRDTDHNPLALQDTSELVTYIRSGAKSPDNRGVGLEHEKFGLLEGPTGLTPLPFEGGLDPLLHTLAERFGWQAHYDQGHIAALTRQRAAITMEPGGQLELSGAVTMHLDETADELQNHLEELLAVSPPGLHWLAMGAQPIASLDQIAWIPKSRYAIMRDALGARGHLAHYMMKSSASVQANFDFTDEDDAASMLSTALHITPIVSALFAASPFSHGAVNGYDTIRCHYWTATDPDRTGYIPGMLEPGYTFSDYVDYLLDMPMLFIRRDERYIPIEGRLTFREFCTRGYREHVAVFGDWDLHMSTAFPEVRLKRHIEVRGTDCVPLPLMMSIAALWKGIFYDHQARMSAQGLTANLDFAQRIALHEQMCLRGLDATLPDGTSLLLLARELVTLARQGLERLCAKRCRDEAVYLDPIDALIFSREQSLAAQARHVFALGGLEGALETFWLGSQQVEAFRNLRTPNPRPPCTADLDVLFRDEHLIALNKPTGVAVHPSPGHQQDNLRCRLQAYLEANAIPFDAPLAPANRLDLEASGVVIFALTTTCRTALGTCFADKSVEKTYWVIVHGRLRPKGVINKALGRGREEKKEARTRYRSLAHTAQHSLAKAWTSTGRTHQVRRHFAAIGHPLLGDTRYGSKRHQQQNSTCARLFLHARQVDFIHPITGQALRILASPDELWRQTVDAFPIAPKGKPPTAAPNP